jgi:hypothetical protein
MIKDIKVGNILDRENRADIIIAMNAQFDDVQGIGKPFVARIKRTREVKLGSVVSFRYDRDRELHMLVCHNLGKGGWKTAEQHVRYGMDYLMHLAPDREYSIVKIGTGRVGKRDGANPAIIHSAMATSFLPVTMFVLNEPMEIPAEASASIIPFRVWNIDDGAKEIRVAA